MQSYLCIAFILFRNIIFIFCLCVSKKTHISKLICVSYKTDRFVPSASLFDFKTVNKTLKIKNYIFLMFTQCHMTNFNQHQRLVEFSIRISLTSANEWKPVSCVEGVEGQRYWAVDLWGPQCKISKRGPSEVTNWGSGDCGIFK